METKEPPVADSPFYDAVDAHIEHEMRRLKMPGVSLAVVEGDQIVHMRGFGRARPGGEAPTPQTLFPIGSVTKSFTALAVMQLVEAGKIMLDDSVQRHLPWFRVADAQASAQMTVRHLLNQTSGLPTSTGALAAADLDAGPGAAERHARALSTLVLARPVGSAYEYSNSNYELLGLIVEATSGESYETYVRDHILIPLGMSRTTTSPALARQNGQAVGHQYLFMIPIAVPNMPAPGGLGGGGLSSCAHDLARYMIAMLNGGCYRNVQILSGAGIDELERGAADTATQMPPELRFARPLAKGISLGRYAMGWIDDKLGKTRVVWHGGTLPDFSAFVALLPEQKKGVVLLFNACHHWLTPVLAEIGLGVTALLDGQQPVSVPALRMIPWALRGQLLMPAVQIAGVVGTLRLRRRWRLDPESRPNGGRAWVQHILLPLIPNLLAALTLIPMLGKRRRYLMLYKPDSSWIVLVCGSLALAWSALRSGLLAAELRRRSPHHG